MEEVIKAVTDYTFSLIIDRWAEILTLGVLIALWRWWVNGLRLVCEGLVQSLFADSPLGHSEQKAAFLAHLRSILERFDPPSSLSDINTRNTAMIKVLQEFSDKVGD